ncbi:MAG: helix-turn-helix transcriptional regulator [Deltaproteobacteria bacterium]|nr:helix-turn-helix transcriptional regulator [Deltaproteobacteria bacterium]
MDDGSGLGRSELQGLLDLSCSVTSGSGLDDFRKRALLLLRETFSSFAANFFITDADAAALNISNVVADGVDPAAFGPYRAYYQYLDPFLQRPLESIGTSLLDEIVDIEEFRRSEYYNDFIKPQGIYHQVGMSLVVRGRCLGVIALFRTAAQPNYTPEEQSRISLMLPYLANDLERALTLEYAKQKKWILEASLQTLGGQAIVVLDLRMNVIFANEEAQSIFDPEGKARTTFGPFGKLPCPVIPEGVRALCAQTARKLLEGQSQAEDPVALSWSDTKGRPCTGDLRVISGYFFGQKAHFIVLHATRSTAASVRIDATLADRYHLTPRELEIAAEALRGSGNPEIADHLCISIHTVENHLKNIFRKMGARSRTEMVCRLLEPVR